MKPVEAFCHNENLQLTKTFVRWKENHLARLRMTTVSAFSMWPVGTARYAGNGEMARARITHFSNPPFNTSFRGFPGGSEVKASARNAGDLGLTPGLGSSPGEGNSNPLQYSCLENPMDEEPGGLQFTESQRVGHD